MRKSREASVDTSALIAFLDRSDTHHPLVARLFADPPKLYTSTLVIAEGHGWFLQRYDSSRALTFLSLIETLAPLTILEVGSATLNRAALPLLLRKFQDQPLTPGPMLSACTSCKSGKRRSAGQPIGTCG